MAERTVSTRLKLNVTDFVNGARQASTSLDDLVKKGDKTGQVASTGLGKIEQSIRLQRGAWDTASTAMLGWGAAATAVVAGVVATYANFDQAMSSVQAATLESADNMALLREAAIEAGADTQYSATEAAGAVEELAKAGVSTSDILSGALAGSLDLAAAGGLGVADAAGIASIALTQFKLEGSDVAHVADLLAAGAGKAMGDVTDLGMALKQSGLVASQTGLSIEETTGGLAAFAAAGLLGSDAGTSFKSMLQRLTPQSAEAQRTMDDLGISAYDAQGNFIGLAAFAGNLQDSLSGLTVEQRNSAMATMFGSDAVRAAAVIYDQGQEGIQGWIDAVDDAGYAADAAAARMDNLKGDWEAFTGSLESLVLKSGTGINDFLRGLVQGMEKVVDVIGQIPAPVLNTVTALSGIGGVSLIAVGGFMKLVTSGHDLYTSFAQLAGISPRVTSALSKLGGAMLSLPAAGVAAGILAAGAAFVYFQQKAAEARIAGRQLAGTLDEVSGAGTELSRKWALDEITDRSGLDNMQRLGVDLNAVGDAVEQMDATKLREMADGLNSLELNGDFNLKNVRDAQGDFQHLARSVEQAKIQQEAANKVLGETGDAADTAADGAGKVGDEMAGATPDIQSYADALAEALDILQSLAQITMSYDEAEIAHAETIRATNEVVQEYVATRAKQLEATGMSAEAAKAAAQAEWDAAVQSGEALDLTTEKGAVTRGALLDVANSAWDVVQAYADTGASSEQLEGRMETLRGDFVSQAQQMGFTEEQANALADSYGLIPSQVKTTITAIDNASGTISQLVRTLNGIDGKRVRVYTEHIQIGRVGLGGSGTSATLDADGSIHTAFANGTERHIAQIGRPGQIRIWNEDETGGEAYIPLAASTRSRSESILSAVATQFGGAFVKPQAFAEGAVVSSYMATAQPGASVVVPAPEVHVTAVVENPWTGEEVEARVARTVVKYV